MVACLEEAGVTHVLGIPDNDTAPLFSRLAEHPTLRLLTVTREGEAFAMAAGLWVGGAVPFVVIQNTGLLESGDALRGTVQRMGVPLVLLVGCRGYARAEAAGRDPAGGPPDTEELVRPDIDSAALMTEPTLAAWSVPCARLAGPADIAEAFRRADDLQRAVALLLTRPLPREAAAAGHP